jgi:hypothetical protein
MVFPGLRLQGLWLVSSQDPGLQPAGVHVEACRCGDRSCVSLACSTRILGNADDLMPVDGGMGLGECRCSQV